MKKQEQGPASLHLKPAKGLKVMKPGTKTPLAPEGEVVDDSSYWRRRLAGKEVEKVEKVERIEKEKEQPKKSHGGEK